MTPVRVYDSPPSHPYMCMKCRNGAETREYFIDTGMQVEWEGLIYLCNECMHDIALACGIYITREYSNTLLADQADMVSKYYDMVDKIKLWDQVFHDLTGTSVYEFFSNLERVKAQGLRDERSTLRIVRSSDSIVADSKSDDSGTTEDDITIKPNDTESSGQVGIPLFTLI